MISVVIPLYNKEQSIVRTLDSVLAQTYTDYECIIVNDGSTDRSAELVEKWINERLTDNYTDINVQKKRNESCRCGCRFRLLSKSNGGVSSARNRGVQEAKGDYIAFLDGDDLWEPNYIDEMMKLVNAYQDAAIYGLGLGRMVRNEKFESAAYLPHGFRGVVKNVWENNRTMMSWTSSSVCVPIELARQTLADEQLTHGEDLDVWLRLMLQGPAVFYNKTLAYYVQDAENRAMRRVPPINHHIVSVIERYREAREANPSFRKAFDTQMIGYLFPYFFSEYKDEAKRLANLLDYSQLKWSLRFRVNHPYLYRAYMHLKGLMSK